MSGQLSLYPFEEGSDNRLTVSLAIIGFFLIVERLLPDVFFNPIQLSYQG